MVATFIEFSDQLVIIQDNQNACAQQRKFFETIQSIESILTQFRDMNM